MNEKPGCIHTPVTTTPATGPVTALQRERLRPRRTPVLRAETIRPSGLQAGSG